MAKVDKVKKKANNRPYKYKQDGNEIVNWFDKNDMSCSAEKTKLLIVGTQANRKSKLDKRNQKLKITISEKEIEESCSEKLLGVVVNNTLTWKHHIYGDSENLGPKKFIKKNRHLEKTEKIYT